MTDYTWTANDADLADDLAHGCDIELAPVHDLNGESMERCDGESEDADLFSVYVHLREGGALCVADRNTYDEARAFAQELCDRSGYPLRDRT